jgi:hypothetical protein
MSKNRHFNRVNNGAEGEQQMAQPEERSTEHIEESSVVAEEQQVAMLDEPLTGEQQQAEPEEHSAEPVQPEGETETLPVAPVLVLGIGQFVRQMMLKSTKNNTEILELVHKHFPEAKTTPACIAWYKSDLRKKGLISGSAVRGARSIVEFTPEMLAELCK